MCGRDPGSPTACGRPRPSVWSPASGMIPHLPPEAIAYKLRDPRGVCVFGAACHALIGASVRFTASSTTCVIGLARRLAAACQRRVPHSGKRHRPSDEPVSTGSPSTAGSCPPVESSGVLSSCIPSSDYRRRIARRETSVQRIRRSETFWPPAGRCCIPEPGSWPRAVLPTPTTSRLPAATRLPGLPQRFWRRRYPRPHGHRFGGYRCPENQPLKGRATASRSLDSTAPYDVPRVR